MRKLAVAAAVSLALASGSAKALILGEINMRSALNQPMNAEIGLSSVESGELDGMIVQLASPEAFARAGIERTQALTDLKFTVVNTAGGQPVIRISSDKPVLEPFLNFLLEVDWTRGRMVREYTVLLDPPVFMTPSAEPRSTVGDTPVLVDSATENSILSPVAIDRGDNAAPFDESAVVVVGGTNEIADTEGGVEVDLGEVVDLSDVGETVAADSGVVSLDGLELQSGSTNDQAITLSDPAANQALSEEANWEVAVLGDTNEVGNEVGAALTIERAPVETESADAETVSLDELSLTDNAVAVTTQSAGQAGDSITVQKNDTLWEIATANKLQGMSTQQMMLALLEANKQAFINGNINLVKAGAILRIPDQSEVASLSQSEAVAQVGVQEQLWREYRDNLRGTTGTTDLAQNDAATDTPADDSASSEASTSDSTTSAQTAGNQSAGSSDVNGAASTETASNAAADNAGSNVSTEAGDASAQTATAATEAGAQQSQNELKIVASEQPATTVASLNTDESESPEAARLGEINLKLKLAREELAAARLEAAELSEQDSELEAMTENMDQLVTLRQNQLAKLQAQLDAARADAAVAGDTDGAADIAMINSDADTAGSVADDAVTSVSESAAEASDTAGDTGDAIATAVTDAAQNVASGAEEMVATGADAVDSASDAVSDAVTNGSDATQEQTPGAVDNNSATAASTAVPTAAAQQPWYQSWLADPKVLGLGVGGLALGGLLFALLRRRRHGDGEEDMDEVVFLDGEGTEAHDVAAEETSHAAMAAQAASHAATIEAESDAQSDEPLPEQEFDQEQTVALPEQAEEHNDTQADQTVAKDDTVSEAEVYLAYGLHGQAEDLLKKAVERNADNADYHVKLLQTYHVQGKAAEFDRAAGEYHERFGGATSPEWQSVVDMGKELNPSNSLYLSSGDDVESVGRGNIDGPKLDFDDFSSTETEGVSSQVREFSSSDEAAVDMDEADAPTTDAPVAEAPDDLMDQTIDPAMAFDESDLEATGDFTKLSEELQDSTEIVNVDPALSDDDGLDFPTEFLDESDDSEAQSEPKLQSAQVGATGGAADGANDDGINFDADLAAFETSTDGLDGVQPETESPTSAEDLSMDLDRLEGELDLDGTEMLEGGLDMTQDLEIPDLTSGGDLTTDASAAFGNADEMDTMMDLAKAYIDMGDNDSASSALGEIVKSGNPEQKTEAENLLRKIS